MITRFFAAVGRHRRVLLGAGLVLSAGYLLVQARVPELGQRAFPAMLAAAGGFILLAVVALAWGRPRDLLVWPEVPAFGTSGPPVYVFIALAFLVMATGLVGNVIRDWAVDPFLSDQLLPLIWGVVALLNIAIAWRGRGVQLRPDGLRQPGLIGWLVVPWEAAPTVPDLPPAPNAVTVPLKYGRPDLVPRGGLGASRRRLSTSEVEPWLLTEAIRHYVAHPEHRAAIGTAAEYDRLRKELTRPGGSR